MTIKARLILSTGALLCLATAVISVVAISAVTGSMTSRLDAQLREYMRQPQVATARAPMGHVRIIGGPAAASAYQAVAVLIVDDAGTVAGVIRAGYFTDPLPPPELPDPMPAEGGAVTAASADGSTDYRLLVVGRVAQLTLDPATGEQTSVSGRLVLAAPMTEVGTVRRQLVTTMAVTVAGVLLLSVLASWWITRRGLRPVGNMIDTAAAIAEGDLSRRVAKPSGRFDELTRLATAINTMVSRLVRAIGERETQQERLRRFVADASHELRTPLATIGGYADLYESGGASSGAMLDRAMSRIRAENLRMAALVDDMLLLARLDQQAEQVYGDCDLSRVVADSVDDARAVDTEREVRAEVASSVVVTGDEARLRQVAANLLANARQHTPPGTTVTVSLGIEGDRAVLSVRDDGPGLDDEHRARAFDRLYRADPSRSRATGGSGLGLSIVASIVAAHKGRVEMTGGPGRGTCVRVELPLAG
ncbi:MAG TPA: HAMP domain-containing sensor histidine kinase [Phytomonospora sp.]